MRLGRLKEYLLPGAAERDEGFCEELLRCGEVGLRVVGGVEVGVAILMLLSGWLWPPVVLGCLGAASMLVTRKDWAYERSRLLALASVFSSGAVLIWYGAGDFILGQIALVMLVSVTAIPMRPIHTLGLGLGTLAWYAACARWRLPVTHLVFLGTLTAIATALTALVYRQRHLSYGAYLQIVRACEDLRESHSRMLVSENAASTVRLAAALSHELNTPLGALLSGVNTLLSLATKRATAPPSDQDRLARLQSDLSRSVEDAAQRLQQTLARMQRFTNLDRTEVQPADLNELLQDVAALLQPEIQGRATLEFDFQPVPVMLCRRQQLSAVFSNLLNNAACAVGQQGSILISTRVLDSRVEVQIRDDGRGVAPQEMRKIFDPGFKTVDGRVLTGNWHMFNARQIIREQGGEIRIASLEGHGTTVTVSLPIGNAGGAA